MGCFKRIPFMTRAMYQAILDRCMRNEEGCLIFEDPTGLVRLDGTAGRPGGRFNAARVVWAETHGDKDLDDHEVVHITECPNTGKPFPLCIEPTHLKLGTAHDTRIACKERGRAKTCIHGDRDRREDGRCRICNRETARRSRQGASA